MVIKFLMTLTLTNFLNSEMVRLDLRLLQYTQDGRRLSSQFPPPRERGLAWSTVRSPGSGIAPQYQQRPLHFAAARFHWFLRGVRGMEANLERNCLRELTLALFADNPIDGFVQPLVCSVVEDAEAFH